MISYVKEPCFYEPTIYRVVDLRLIMNVDNLIVKKISLQETRIWVTLASFRIWLLEVSISVTEKNRSWWKSIVFICEDRNQIKPPPLFFIPIITLKRNKMLYFNSFKNEMMIHNNFSSQQIYKTGIYHF